MTFEIALTLGIILVAVILLATEKLRPDLVALLVMLALVITGLIDVEGAFQGFASPAVVTVWAVYIVSAALFKTGVTDVLSRWMMRLAGSSEPRLIAVVMLMCGTISAFVNNIGATAMLIPAVVGVSRKTKVPLSRLLIPLAFASLLGGNMTEIGTPPNILATAILAERGFTTFRLFDFTPTGVLVFATGVLYMISIGRLLLPSRPDIDAERSSQLRRYVTEIRVRRGSPLAGLTLAQARLNRELGVTVLALIRDEQPSATVGGDTRIEVGDLLIVSGDVPSLMEARDALGVAIEPDFEFDLDALTGDSAVLVEAVLPSGSRLVGSTPREMRFRDRYGFTVLAVWRRGEILARRVGDFRLRAGDVLLLKGPRENLADLQRDQQILVLEGVEQDEQRRHKAPWALGIIALVLGLIAIGGLHVSLAMVIGAVLTVLTGCLTMDEAYEAIEWRSIFLIAGMLPLGTVMDTTGTARFLADQIVRVTGQGGPIAVMAGTFILAGLITEVMSNAAAAVLMVPIAIDTALSLGAQPHGFVLATVIGASTSFLTPFGHQVNVLVFGVGNYRFSDFARVGALLSLALLAVTLLAVPLFWPFHP